MQPTGSLALTPAQRRAGVVAVSAGNHAQGVAHHAIRLGIPVTVLMPITAPLAKVANTARLGATVIQHGATVAETMERLGELEAAGLTLIHPYDDPLVIAGQGTVGLELLDRAPRPRGARRAGRRWRPDRRRLRGGRTAGAGAARSSACSRTAIRSPRCAWAGRAAERRPRRRQHRRRHRRQAAGRDPAVDHRPARRGVLTVPEHRIEEAIGLLAEVEKTVAEGAAAAAWPRCSTGPSGSPAGGSASS